MNKSSLYISLLALVVSAAAIVVSTKKPETSAASSLNTEELAVVLNDNPQMIINALQKYEQVQRENQAKEAAKLFVNNIDEINNNPDTPFVGPKDAKIVLVEFFDFSCGYCKRLVPAIEQIIANNPDVKVVFKPITFVGPTSRYAAQAAMAANEQGKFMPMYKAMLGVQERLTEDKINEIAKGIGLDMDKYNADLKSEKVQRTINGVASLADKVQIHGVPSLILNGSQLQTIDADGIQAEINKLK